MEELEGRQMAVATMNMPNGYKNLFKAQIAALKKELARRSRAAAVARNQPRRPTRAAKVIQKKFKNMFYTPNNNSTGLRGRGYRMTMARVRGNNASRVGARERITGMLRTKLNNLRRQTNRGAMVNIYNGMYNKWMAAGGTHGANILNSAQLLMHRRGLIM
jgi:Zn-dependent protease with chaperone function